MRKLKLGVLVSGGGSNLQSIIDNIKSGNLNADISVVISSRDNVYALERAKNNNIPSFAVLQRDYSSKKDYEKELIRILRENDVDLVVLAGFLKVLSPYFVKAFKNRIINIHPSLIPAFCGEGYYGQKVHRAVLDYGAKVTGVTVHFVDEGTDTGPIILQKAVEVKDNDTSETLAARVLQEEHKIYPKAIKLYSEGRLMIDERRVLIKEKEED